MIEILNAEPEGYSSAAREVLLSLGKLTERPVNRAELLACVAGYDVLIVRLGHQLDREVLAAARRLRVIVTATTGLDHIDLHAANEQGITVLSLHGESAFLETVTATAEHTWALLLALLRHIPAAFEAVKAGEWNRDKFRGQELSGKRLGILGFGRVGRQVARFGLAFGMTVFAYDTDPAASFPTVTRTSSLQELCQNSDVLSLHIPLAADTLHIINADALAALPFGALLINTARGEIVDEAALVTALQAGKLAGAGLDVLTGERDPTYTSPLLSYARTHDNLLITPHLAGTAAMHKTELFMAHKLKDFIYGA